MTSILDAADQLRDFADIHFVLVGDGVKKSGLITQAMSRNLKNVTFLGSVPHDRMPSFLAGADVCLIPLRNLPLLEGTLPFKMFEIMACARPFILSGEGIARQLVEQEARAAICIESENVNALVSAILHLHDHPNLAKVLGQSGREFVEARFVCDQQTTALETCIAGLLEKKKLAFLPMSPAAGVAAENSKTYSLEQDIML